MKVHVRCPGTKYEAGECSSWGRYVSGRVAYEMALRGGRGPTRWGGQFVESVGLSQENYILTQNWYTELWNQMRHFNIGVHCGVL